MLLLKSCFFGFLFTSSHAAPQNTDPQPRIPRALLKEGREKKNIGYVSTEKWQMIQKIMGMQKF